MLDKKNAKQISIGVIGSLIAAALIWLSRKTLGLEVWQLVSLCLLLLNVALFAIAVYLYNSSRYSSKRTSRILELYKTEKPDIAEGIKYCERSFKFLGISSKRTMSNPFVQKKIIEICREKGEVKILLLNPDSKFVSDRANDEEESPKAWVSDIKATIERLKGLAEREHINIEIRLYDQYPIWRISNFDNNEMYINFFLKGKQGPQSHLLCINNQENDLFSAFVLEYERIWSASVDA